MRKVSERPHNTINKASLKATLLNYKQYVWSRGGQLFSLVGYIA